MIDMARLVCLGIFLSLLLSKQALAEVELGANVRAGGLAVRVDGENSGAGFFNGRGTVKTELGGGVDFEGHVFGTVRYLTNEADALIPEREGHGQYRAIDLLLDNDTGTSWQALTFIDRLSLGRSFGPVDLTLGRQAVTFGKAYFWNPLDVFRPFSAEQINRDYKAGVDAVRLDWELNAFSGITLVSVLGSEVDILGRPFGDDREARVDTYGSALVARYTSHISGWDLAVQAGKIYGGTHGGAAVVGDLGPIQVRAEGAYFDAIDRPAGVLSSAKEATRSLFTDYWQAAIGAGYRWPNSLQIDGEYYYNGAGSPEDQLTGLFRTAIGASRQTNTHLSGVRTSYEITPILVASLVSIHGFSDDSGLVQSQLVWSLNDETDFLLTGSAGYGRRPAAGAASFPRALTRVPGSEFGAGRGAVLVEVRSFF